ncbi:MAG: DUF222 domain-containing protein [Labedaea sp.]
MNQPAASSLFGALPGAMHAAGFVAAITDMRRAYAVALEHVAEMGRAQTAHCAGYTSQAAFVAELVHINRQKAARMIAQAEQISPSATPTGHTAPATLPTLRAALLEGLVDGEHIDARRRRHQGTAHLGDRGAPGADGDHSGRDSPNAQCVGGARPRAGVAQPVQPGRHRPTARRPRSRTRQHTFRYRLLPSGRIKYAGEADTETAEELQALFGPLAKPTPPAQGVPDPRPVEQRQGDAFAAVVHLAVTAGDAPVHGGTKPHLNVILDHTILTEGLGTATLDCGTAINAHAVRKLACDAELIPMVLNTEGVPLDVGREHRLVTKDQRTALVARDRGCAFPGCHLPARWTDAHHIRHWTDGGRTDLANLVLLCRRHHRIVRGTEWSIQVLNGIPYFRPPKWMDLEQKLVRNVLRR